MATMSGGQPPAGIAGGTGCVGGVPVGSIGSTPKPAASSGTIVASRHGPSGECDTGVEAMARPSVIHRFMVVREAGP